MCINVLVLYIIFMKITRYFYYFKYYKIIEKNISKIIKYARDTKNKKVFEMLYVLAR